MKLAELKEAVDPNYGRYFIRRTDRPGKAYGPYNTAAEAQEQISRPTEELVVLSPEEAAQYSA